MATPLVKRTTATTVRDNLGLLAAYEYCGADSGTNFALFVRTCPGRALPLAVDTCAGCQGLITTNHYIRRGTDSLRVIGDCCASHFQAAALPEIDDGGIVNFHSTYFGCTFRHVLEIDQPYCQRLARLMDYRNPHMNTMANWLREQGIVTLPADTIMTHGKYAGLTWAGIVVRDRGYCQWMVKRCTARGYQPFVAWLREQGFSAD